MAIFCDCIGDGTTSFLSTAVPKETKLSEDNNSLHHTDNRVIDAVSESQSQKLSQSATDTLLTHQASLTEKAKKKKTKSKKRSEKIVIGSGYTGDDISALEFDSSSVQSSVPAADESGSVGKRSKKVRNEGLVVRSEDVDGYCGSLPVDDLIEFIDCGRKLWRSRSRPNAGLLTETEKLQSMKKESVKDAAVENDSGFGDTEISDRADGSHSDGALSPSVSSVSESVDVVVEMLSDLLIPAADQSAVEMNEESLISSVHEMTASSSITMSGWNADSELSFAASFLSGEEFAKPEPEFTVVRQKKRRTKNQKVAPDKAECETLGPVASHNSSMVCSSASSERSNSPQSTAVVYESTVSGFINRQMSDAQDNTSRNDSLSFRRYNSEPKCRATCPRFRPTANTSAELHPVRTQAYVSTNPSARRWMTVSGGKYVPFTAASQQRRMDKMKDRKYNLSAGIPGGSQLPDVIPSAERPRHADKPCLSLTAKVAMQDAHCQTVGDDRSESADQDSSTDRSQTAVPFDLLTLQLFMYHGEYNEIFCIVCSVLSA